MTQYKNIPQPGDNRNVSQNDILQNFLYLSNPLTGAPGVNGILPVDHSATGDNAATPKDGFHNQVSYISQPIKNNTTNAVNGQVADGMTYVKPGQGNFPQELWYIFGNDAPATNYKQVPLSAIRGLAYCNQAGGFTGTGQYNIASNVYAGSGVYTITFTNGFPTVPSENTNYIVNVSPESTTLCAWTILPTNGINGKHAASFQIHFFNPNTGNNLQPTNFGIQVIAIL